MSGSNTTTQTSSTSLPDYIQPYVQDLLGMSQTAAHQPYTANPNQQVADTTAATNQANSLITGIANAGTPAGITNAQTTLQGIAGYQPTSIANADLSKYMSPYTQQVLDVQKQQASQDFQEQQAGRDSAAVQAGAFGGSRQALVNSEAQRNLNTQLQGIEATGLNTAYNNATNLFQNDQSNQLQANQLGINAANAEGNLAGNANTLALQNAAALSGVGTQQQTQQQNVLNAQNTEWQRQNNYPAAQAGLYASLLNGTYQPQTSTSTTTPAPSLISQLLGLGTAGVGIAGLL